jgi:hypothetical protein
VHHVRLRLKLWHPLEASRPRKWGCGACASTCSSLTLLTHSHTLTLTHSLSHTHSRAFLMQPLTSLPTHPLLTHSLTLLSPRPLDWSTNAAVRWCMSRRDGDWFFEKEILWPGQVRFQSQASTFWKCKHRHMQQLQAPRSSCASTCTTTTCSYFRPHVLLELQARAPPPASSSFFSPHVQARSASTRTTATCSYFRPHV